jgi:dipeptidase E
MRMYLSSFRLGDHPERLLALLDPPGPAAVIANAMDADPDDVRRRGVQHELVALEKLGLDADELDLRGYFGSPKQLRVELSRYQLVWLRGGNVFMLRSALAQSGADAVLADLLRRDALVYGGYSAGPCVLGPTLRGLETADDPQMVPATYGVPPIWAGLGLLKYTIVPHYQSPAHPETALMGLVAQRYQEDGVPHQTLRDGQAIVINSGTTTIG